MGLYSEMLQQSGGKPVCKMQRLLSECNEIDRQEIIEALENPMISTNAIHRVLNNNKINIGYTALNKHRMKGCACADS